MNTMYRTKKDRPKLIRRCRFYRSRIQYCEEEIEQSKVGLRADMVKFWQVELATFIKSKPSNILLL